MKRRAILASSFVLALAAGTVSSTGAADAAMFRHHGGGHAMNHYRGDHFNGGHRYAYRRGYGRHWAGGGWRGGDYGDYYDYCGPVQLALGLCVPYRPYYGPFGIL